ncbi:protein of unknown function DUF239 [Macleaya cordata]|uniref:Neprosin PEP catalytic domain-containing protein n=1 Tax=Macleaya cordata TaxID=56857 RepID=A0A200PR16_MACCD|nr:protein of unknown function DUF239 [Macleaya cordata]
MRQAPPLGNKKSEYGHGFECVNIDKQPGLEHPLLKNHIIQFFNREPNGPLGLRVQDKKCPSGRIPVPRRSISLKKGLKDGPYFYTMIRKVGHFLGTKGISTVAYPTVGHDGQFYRCKLWITGPEGTNQSSIQIGWEVFPKKYGDDMPHFFTFLTTDSYRTICYHMECTGYIQVSRIIVPSMIIYQSESAGSQFNIEISIQKERQTGNWWVRVGDEYVGYWPKGVLPNVDFAQNITWGCEDSEAYVPTMFDNGHSPHEGLELNFNNPLP